VDGWESIHIYLNQSAFLLMPRYLGWLLPI